MTTENTNPDTIGQLTDEEHQNLVSLRAQSQDILSKIGQMEVQKIRLLNRLDEMDTTVQSVLANITARLGLAEGQQWVALQDGSIRLVKPSMTTPE